MNRRSFFKMLAGIPFLPAALKDPILRITTDDPCTCDCEVIEYSPFSEQVAGGKTLTWAKLQGLYDELKRYAP